MSRCQRGAFGVGPLLSAFALACSGDAPSDGPGANAGAGVGGGAITSGAGGAGAGTGSGAGSGAGAGAGAGAGSGGSASSDAGTSANEPGPPVVVTPIRVPTLFFRGAAEICRIDERQDLVCLASGASEWRLVEPGPFVSIAVSNWSDGHICGAHPDGSVRCWHLQSRDPEAPLCRGTMPPCVNEGVAPPGRYVSLTAGLDLSCGLTDEGTIHCWGIDSEYGAALPPAGDDFVAIDGAAAQCALRQSGEVSCWGDFAFDYDRTPLTEAATQFEVLSGATCALTADGRALCDGDRDLVLPPDLRYARLSLGSGRFQEEGVCGLTADGAITCVGTPWLDRITPSPGPYLEMVNSGNDVCALRGDGVVECWGEHWGNGGGVERCELSEARLSLNGAESVLVSGENAWAESVVGDTPGWSFAETFTTPDGDESITSGFAWIAGSESGQPPWVDTGDVFREGAEVVLTHSVWALEASATAPGELFCTAEGSGSVIRRHADELVFDVRELASLGSCPGTPVAGELRLCNGCAGPALSGSLDGVALSADIWLGGRSEVWFTDRTHLQLAHTTPASTELAWGILITSPNGPTGAQVICIGSGSFEQAAEAWTFRDLSSLGACPGAGTGSLSGCVR